MIAALAVALLVAGEVGLRIIEPRMSPYLRHLHSLPQVSKQLAQAHGLRVLFLGNSMVRTDLDLGLFLERVNDDESGPLKQVSGVKVYIDDSHISEWFYTFKHSFIDVGSVPDVVVIGFADYQLGDHADVRPRRLARFHASLSDVPELFSNDLLTFADRSEFLLSYAFASYALRDRVRNRVLFTALPYYPDTALKLNDNLWSHELETAPPSSWTYRRLERLDTLADKHGVSVLLVAMPKAGPYDLPQELFRKAGELGVRIVDLREAQNLSPGMFADEMHMRPEGATVFSGVLATHLAKPLREIGRSDLVKSRPPASKTKKAPHGERGEDALRPLLLRPTEKSRKPVRPTSIQ